MSEPNNSNNHEQDSRPGFIFDTDEPAPYAPRTTLSEQKGDTPSGKPEGRFSLRTKLIGAGVVGLLAAGVGILGASQTNGSEAPTATPTSSAEAEPQILNQTEALQERIDSRPEEGSVEYMELFSDCRAPYIEGQTPEEVAVEYQKNLIRIMAVEYSDVANMTDSDIAQWATENGTGDLEETARGIVEQLDLDYYQTGVLLSVYGIDNAQSKFTRTVLPRMQAEIKESVVSFLRVKVNPNKAAYQLVDAGIIKSDETNINAFIRGYLETPGGSAEDPNIESNVHLRVAKNSAGQTNWYLFDNAKDEFSK